MASGQSSSPPDHTGSPVINLEIYDIEKVRGLSNYYLYVIQASCKDGSSYVLRRRYRQFDDLYKSLDKRFPIEAGSIKAKERILPDLPGKVIFGRSAIKEVTTKRLPILNGYLKNLMELPDKIRYDTIVNTFTRPSADDMQAGIPDDKGRSGKPAKPPPPNKKAFTQARTDRPLRPQLPPSKEKKFHTQIRPAPPPRPNPPKEPHGKALYDYTGQYSDELSFVEGDMISLLSRSSAEWWEGRLNGRVGLVPSNYIEVLQAPVKRNMKDMIQSSDEWDSSEDEEVGKVTCYFNGAARNVEVSLEIVKSPSYTALLRAVQKHLHRYDVALNYKDRSGDLVEMVDNDDTALLVTEGIPPRKLATGSGHAPWAIYVTLKNNSNEYRRQKTPL